MNMKYLKSVAIVTTITIFMNSGTALAASREDGRKIKQAGEYLSAAMELILDRYSGDSVSIDQLYEGALAGMTNTLDDYSYYVPEKEIDGYIDSIVGETSGIGVMFFLNQKGEHEISAIIEGTPAEAVGLREGDIFRAIDGQEVSGLSSNELVAKITGGESDQVLITVERGGELINVEITKSRIDLKTVTVKKLEDVKGGGESIQADNSLRYVHISSVDAKTGDELRESIAKMKSEKVTGIIIDFRGNPGGLVSTANDICNQLVPKGLIYYTVDNAGKREDFSSNLTTKPFEKMVVLIDADTASAAELITSALQDSGAATVVGQTSFGKGVFQEFMPIRTGGALTLTIAEYFSRNGNKINNVGVVPDVDIYLPEYASFPVFINENNHGDELPKVKAILEYIGYNIGNKSTELDEVTVAALKEFQKAHGLNMDGVLDFETTIALNDSLYTYVTNNDEAFRRACEILAQ